MCRCFVLFFAISLLTRFVRLLQLFSWIVPSRRSTPPAARAQEQLRQPITDDNSTVTPSATVSASASASASATLAAATLTATGAAVDAAAAAGSDVKYGIAAEEQDKVVEGEPKMVDGQRFEANADDIADGNCAEDEEGRYHHFDSAHKIYASPYMVA